MCDTVRRKLLKEEKHPAHDSEGAEWTYCHSTAQTGEADWIPKQESAV